MKDAKSGTLYIYNLPAELGIDSQLAPNAGLASKVAAVSIMPTHTTQLLGRFDAQRFADWPLGRSQQAFG